MERLPYIDDHLCVIAATPAQVWIALLRTLGSQFGNRLPRRLVAVWGLEQPTRRGDWTTSVSVGDTVLGFAVAETDPWRRLTLRGGHRFSQYELQFELEAIRPHRVQVHAKTWAAFPGVQGRIYRALVISTGGHRIAVRWILRLLARRAERNPGAPQFTAQAAASGPTRH